MRSTREPAPRLDTPTDRHSDPIGEARAARADIGGGVRVELSFWETLQAAIVGCKRQIENARKGREAKHGAAGGSKLGPYQMHIEGACGELAFAKASGLYWSGAHEFRARDVGTWQVRQAASPAAHLLVYRNDFEPDARYVLVTGSDGVYEIRGWIHGRDAAGLAALATDGEWYVPQARLKPFRVAVANTPDPSLVRCAA